MLAKNLLGAAKAVEPAYIEDVFSTYLYTGTGATQTITNGIDLSGKGGLVWIKSRTASIGHALMDTNRGVSRYLNSDTTASEQLATGFGVTNFGSTGFTVVDDSSGNYGVNGSGGTYGGNYVSWTFRKQPKFFDVVTFTTSGTLSSNRSISHSLGSAPGFIVVKGSSNGSNWLCYHRSLGQSSYVALQSTNAQNTNNQWWTATAPTATTFNVNETLLLNTNQTYVAYLFAHDAGGFGPTGADNVISCGSYTGNGSSTGPVVTLGYEPQWLLVKRASTSGPWYLVDNMRSLALTGSGNTLWPNYSLAENSYVGFRWAEAQATGFQIVSSDTEVNASGSTYIYIAIRRGPMKVPTSGTSVFSPYAATTPGNAVVTTGFPVDFQMQKNAAVGTDMRFVDRLRGVSSTPTSPSSAFPFLVPSDTTAESTGTGTTLNWNNTGFTVGNTYSGSAQAWAVNFRRAPGFFDVVCYTGNGVAGRTVSHNLAAVPELIIGKTRNNTIKWTVYSASVGNTAALFLNLTDTPETGSYFWNNTSPTSTNFTLGDSAINNSGNTHVAYLFATCPGVSKVGSYTGTGTTKQIDCGFTGGARFVLIKRTDSTGDWYVWDSARGIVAGNDSYLLLNSTAAEVTNTDYIDTYSAGFEISSTAPAAINANGGTFVFFAVA